MLFTLIAAVLAAIFAPIIFKLLSKEDVSTTEFVGISISAGLVTFVVTAGATFIASSWLEQPVRNDIPLVAAKDSAGASGTFVLGTGSVNGELTYYAYVKDANTGAIRPMTFTNPSVITIFEDGADNPHITEAYSTCTDLMWCWGATGKIKYEFHVPPGSVTTTTQLDLE